MTDARGAGRDPKNGGLVAGDYIRLISNAFEDALLELDAEGVTYADGVYYVIGSHGRPRHEDGGRKPGTSRGLRRQDICSASPFRLRGRQGNRQGQGGSRYQGLDTLWRIHQGTARSQRASSTRLSRTTDSRSRVSPRTMESSTWECADRYFRLKCCHPGGANLYDFRRSAGRGRPL